MIKKNLPKKMIIQLFRYYSVGFILNLMGYFVYIIVTQNFVTPEIAAMLAYIFVIALSYFTSKYFVFQKSNKSHKSSFMKFLILHGFCIIMTVLLLYFARKILKIPHEFALPIISVCISIVLFTASKIFIFSELKADQKGK